MRRRTMGASGWSSSRIISTAVILMASDPPFTFSVAYGRPSEASRSYEMARHAPESSAAAKDVVELVVATRSRALYRGPSAGETARATKLFEALLARGEPRAADLEAWGELGFDLVEVTMATGRGIAVRETRGREEGRGVFIVRTTPAEPVAIEAPHRLNDVGTEQIAARLMDEAPFAAVALNTVSRRLPGEVGQGSADLAHLEPSYLNAFTRAFARTHPRGTIVQPHGFHSRPGEAELLNVDIILSGARRPAPPHLGADGECLRRSGFAVALFPDDTRTLGGTKNANAAAFREVGGKRFLHLEMSRYLRDSLQVDAEKRQRLARCFLRGQR